MIQTADRELTAARTAARNLGADVMRCPLSEQKSVNRLLYMGLHGFCVLYHRRNETNVLPTASAAGWKASTLACAISVTENSSIVSPSMVSSVRASSTRFLINLSSRVICVRALSSYWLSPQESDSKSRSADKMERGVFSSWEASVTNCRCCFHPDCMFQKSRETSEHLLTLPQWDSL